MEIPPGTVGVQDATSLRAGKESGPAQAAKMNVISNRRLTSSLVEVVMNRTSLVIALIVPSLFLACGAGENTVGTDWDEPDAGNPQDTGNASDSCNNCTPGAAQLAISRRQGCPAVVEGIPGQTITFDITNTGSAASRPLSSTFSNGPDAPLLLITSDTCAESTLAPGATCTVVVFAASPFTTITAPEIATLIVSDGQTSSSAPLPVSDGGIVTASPVALDFGQVAAGSTSTEMIVRVTTTSKCETKLTAAINNPNFVISSNTCTVAVTGACQIGVRFAPPEGPNPSTSAGFLTVTASDSGSAIVALTGVISPPHPTPFPLTVSPAALNFGEVIVGTSATGTITVSAAKASPTAVLSGSGADSFAIVANTCTTPGETCTLEIKFAPTTAGPRTATLSISDGQIMATVALQGQGLAISVTTSFAATPATMDFGAVSVGLTSSPLIVTVTTPAARTFKLSLSDSAAAEVSIAEETCTAPVPAGGTCTISVTYTPAKVSTMNGVLNISDGTSVSAVTLAGEGWSPL